MAQRTENESSPSAPLPFVRSWLPGLALVVGVILIYLPVWRAGFIWDDDVYITKNPALLGWGGLGKIWTTSADISPLTTTTFWLEHALWGVHPLPYHLVNVLMHGACAVALWRVLRGMNLPGAWLGAALWAIHPVMVESVAWVSELKNPESGLFFLLAILFFAKSIQPPATGEKSDNRRAYAWALIFAALAMAAKSSTVILPVVLGLYAWCMEGRWRWRNVAITAPFLLLSAVASLSSLGFEKSQIEGLAGTAWQRTWPERLVTAGDVVWFYLGKLIWPHPLATIYPRWDLAPDSWISYLPLLAVVAVLLSLWALRHGPLRSVFFAFAYFLVALLPVAGLVENTIFRYTLVFDHLQYLAAMGPLALAGAGLFRAREIVFARMPAVHTALYGALLLTLALVSGQRSRVYESSETLWTDALAKNSECWLGNYNLGVGLVHQRRLDAAVAQFHRALQLHPAYPEACINLGVAYQMMGKLDDAIAQIRDGLKFAPNDYEGRSDLGDALSQQGKTGEAIGEFRRALQIDPTIANGHYNLANALSDAGQLPEAIAEYQAALQRDPNLPKAHNNLGIALAQTARPEEAAVEFEQAIRLDPTYPDPPKNLALVQTTMAARKQLPPQK